MSAEQRAPVATSSPNGLRPSLLKAQPNGQPLLMIVPDTGAAMDNLLDDLGARNVDQEELHKVLIDHYSRATQHDDRRIAYMREEGQPALELLYSRDARLIAIRAGAHLQADDLATLKRTIKEGIIDPGPTQYARAVLFSHLPVTGHYRWGESFQILPVPPHAPQPPFPFTSLNPFLLEAAYAGSTHSGVSTHRQGKRLNELELALAPLLYPGVRMQPRYTEHHWIYEPEGEQFRTAYRQAGYGYDDANGRPEGFSDVSAIAPLKLYDFQKYYAREGVGIDQSLELPDSIDASLDIVSRLSPSDYQRYLRAGYWFLYSKNAWSLSKSACFTALVSAIEALLPDPAAPTPCASCEKDTNPGPTAQFREFLNRLLPEGSVSSASKNEIYRIRSKLAHGDRLFYEDQIGFGFNVTSTNESNRLRHLSNVVQIAIYNWLHLQPLAAASMPEALPS